MTQSPLTLRKPRARSKIGMFLSGSGREPPFVCKVVAGGIAGSAGVRVGDQIISINGVYCIHGEAQTIGMIREAVGEITLVLRYDDTLSAPALERGLRLVNGSAALSEAVNLSTLEC